ncbi:MAG: glycosyltransferase, partial [Candidatus Levybacteria bacterium]|nr:glycosyltransferase [Candidatus Levybacteria bacterium]
DKIAISFEESVFKSEKVILTGNPIRREIIEKSLVTNVSHSTVKQKLPRVLIMGGNQGSHVINLAVEKCLNQLLKMAVVIHQTGDSKYRDFERLKELGKSEEKYIIRKWIGEEYGEILQKADLVISRAGINTLTELSLLGKPVLLIPIPNAEQNKNAKYFEDLGLAKKLPQSRLSPEALLENITTMLKDLDSLKEKAKEVKKVIITDGAKRLALETILLGNGSFKN